MNPEIEKTPEFRYGDRLEAEMATVRTLHPDLLPEEVRRQAVANLEKADAEWEAKAQTAPYVPLSGVTSSSGV